MARSARTRGWGQGVAVGFLCGRQEQEDMPISGGGLGYSFLVVHWSSVHQYYTFSFQLWQEALLYSALYGHGRV
jgi:hypothetical protein